VDLSSGEKSLGAGMMDGFTFKKGLQWRIDLQVIAAHPIKLVL